MDDAEVEGKFRRLSVGVLAEQHCGRVLELVWSLEQMPDLEALFDRLVV